MIVDDASSDGTVAAVTALLDSCECVRLIRLSRAFGLDVAISAGLDSVIGDFVVVMLPHSDPVDRIPEIVEAVRRGAGVMFGVYPSRGEGLLTRAGGALFSWYCRRVLGLPLPANAAIYRGLSRQAVNALIQMRDRCRYLPILSAQIGYDSATFEYVPRPRGGRPAHRGLAAAATLAVDVLTTASSHPLRFVTWLGLLAGACNGLYTLYVIAVYVFKPDVAEGWTTLSLQNAAMFFFVFLILTVMSEYVGHILVQSEARPLYHVVEERTSPVSLADEARRNVVRQDAGAGALP